VVRKFKKGTGELFLAMMYKKIYYGWYMVAVCFLLCFLFAGAGFYSFSIFIKPIEAEFGWSRSAISLTMSIYLVLGGLMGPVVGRVLQQYGPRKVMRAGAFFAGISFMLVSLTQSLWYFYATYALLALSISHMAVIPVSSLLANWFDKRRGTAVGIAMVGISAGGLLLAPFVGWVTVHFGWKYAFLGIGLIVWTTALPAIHFFVRDKPSDIGAFVNGASGLKSVEKEKNELSFDMVGGVPAHQVLKSRSFWCIFLAFFLAPFSQMGVLQHQVPIIMDSGISGAMATAALGVTAGVGGIGKLSFGRLSEILPFRYVVLICFGLQALGVVLLINTHTVIALWLYVILFGFSMGGVVVLIPLVVAHYWGLVSYGVLLGIVWAANAIGGACGTYSSGLLYDVLGNYEYALYLFILAYIVSILIFFAAGKPIYSDTPDIEKN